VTGPLALTDDQLEQLMTAARSLRPERRDAFVQQVAAALAAGAHSVHHAIRVAADWNRNSSSPLPVGESSRAISGV
jgi:hypothetical protein